MKLSLRSYNRERRSSQWEILILCALRKLKSITLIKWNLNCFMYLSYFMAFYEKLRNYALVIIFPKKLD